MSNQLAEALRRLIDASMVAMTDQELATGETLSAWEDANEALAAHEAAKPAEPLAWLVCSVNKDGSLSLEHAAPWRESAHEHINDAINNFGIREAARWVVRPAYAAPVAVASPLSDEMLDRLEDGCWDGPGLGARFDKRKFARAIEAAHGIKEKP